MLSGCSAALTPGAPRSGVEPGTGPYAATRDAPGPVSGSLLRARMEGRDLGSGTLSGSLRACEACAVSLYFQSSQVSGPG